MTAKITLTECEKNVLKELYFTVRPNLDISKVLKTSLGSVKFHAWNIYNKLGVNSRLELKDLNPKLIKGLVDEK